MNEKKPRPDQSQKRNPGGLEKQDQEEFDIPSGGDSQEPSDQDRSNPGGSDYR